MFVRRDERDGGLRSNSRGADLDPVVAPPDLLARVEKVEFLVQRVDCHLFGDDELHPRRRVVVVHHQAHRAPDLSRDGGFRPSRPLGSLPPRRRRFRRSAAPRRQRRRSRHRCRSRPRRRPRNLPVPVPTPVSDVFFDRATGHPLYPDLRLMKRRLRSRRDCLVPPRRRPRARCARFARRRDRRRRRRRPRRRVRIHRHGTPRRGVHGVAEKYLQRLEDIPRHEFHRRVFGRRAERLVEPGSGGGGERQPREIRGEASVLARRRRERRDEVRARGTPRRIEPATVTVFSDACFRPRDERAPIREPASRHGAKLGDDARGDGGVNHRGAKHRSARLSVRLDERAPFALLRGGLRARRRAFRARRRGPRGKLRRGRGRGPRPRARYPRAPASASAAALL